MQHWSRRQTLLAAAGSALAASGLEACASLPPVWQVAPELDALAPAAPREFRAAWVATVANIDWPSRKGLSSAEQQAQIRAIVDRAAELGLNALILQVRTSADAFYPSALEPWSEYLTGTQGQAPEPFYDPLALWIELAHARGMELHAWFNPFRARQSAARSAPHASHVSQSQPSWVKTYGDQLWMDPGEPAAAAHTLAVFQDVLQRYDVDGIHIDDYFYPYPVTENAQSKTEIDFPDQPAWQRYLDGGGTLERADWRRDNVNRLVERIYTMIRSTKPWVQFGISLLAWADQTCARQAFKALASTTSCTPTLSAGCSKALWIIWYPNSIGAWTRRRRLLCPCWIIGTNKTAKAAMFMLACSPAVSQHRPPTAPAAGHRPRSASKSPPRASARRAAAMCTSAWWR